MRINFLSQSVKEKTVSEKVSKCVSGNSHSPTHRLTHSLGFLLLLAGCAAHGPERTLHYTVPQFEYEQHEPQFSPLPTHPLTDSPTHESISAPVGSVTNVTLRWDYPAAELAGITFKLYSHTNLLVPWATWPVIAVTTNLHAVVPMQPQQRFFYATASNFWGETSPPSNSAGTPPPPRSVNTAIELGP